MQHTLSTTQLSFIVTISNAAYNQKYTDTY